MIVHVIGDEVYYELETPMERKQLMEVFFKRIDNIIRQNHRFKFKSPKQIECMLNRISQDLRLDITFKLIPYLDEFGVEFDNMDLNMLDDVVDEFRVRYRHQRGC